MNSSHGTDIALGAGDRPDRVRLTDRRAIAWITERVGSLLVLLVTAVVVIAPVAYVFAETSHDNFDGIRRLLRDPFYGEALRNTLVLSAGSVLVATGVGATFGWWAHGLPPSRRWLGLLPLFPLVIPTLSFLLGFIFLFNPAIGYLNVMLRWVPGMGKSGPFDVYTVPWMIVVTGLNGSAYVFLFVRSALNHLHQDLVDAAASSGATPRRAFWLIVVPLLRPALTYGAITVTVLTLGQFTVPLLLGRQGGTRVLTTEIFYRLNAYPVDRALAASYGLTIILAGVICLGFQRWMLRSQERYVMVSSRGGRPYRGKGRLPLVGFSIYGIVFIFLPLASLVLVSLQPYWSKDVRLGDLTFANFVEVGRNDALLAAVRNSLMYGAGAAIITVPLAYLIARTIFRRRRTPVLAGLQEVAVSLPLGVPHVIMGAGFLLLYLNSPLRLYGRALGLIVMYLVIMLPFATRMILTAMSSLGEQFSNAAAVCGASPWRRVLQVELPLLRPAMGAAAALVVVLTSHEFSASVLVRSRGTAMMGPVMYDLWTFGSYPLTAVMALIMCVVTGVGVLTSLAIGGSGTLMRMGSGHD